MTVTEFLEARIAEDEAVAEEPRGRRWSTGLCYEIEGENGECVLEVGHDGRYDFKGNVLEHMARWDPARVMAECAAKRAILSDYAGAVSAQADTWRSRDDVNYNKLSAKCLTRVLSHLAAVYSDHPDYDKDWAL